MKDRENKVEDHQPVAGAAKHYVSLRSRSHEAAKVRLQVRENNFKTTRNKLQCSDLLSGVRIGEKCVH